MSTFTIRYAFDSSTQKILAGGGVLDKNLELETSSVPTRGETVTFPIRADLDRYVFTVIGRSFETISGVPSVTVILTLKSSG